MDLTEHDDILMELRASTSNSSTQVNKTSEKHYSSVENLRPAFQTFIRSHSVGSVRGVKRKLFGSGGETPLLSVSSPSKTCSTKKRSLLASIHQKSLSDSGNLCGIGRYFFRKSSLDKSTKFRKTSFRRLSDLNTVSNSKTDKLLDFEKTEKHLELEKTAVNLQHKITETLSQSPHFVQHHKNPSTKRRTSLDPDNPIKTCLDNTNDTHSGRDQVACTTGYNRSARSNPISNHTVYFSEEKNILENCASCTSVNTQSTDTDRSLCCEQRSGQSSTHRQLNSVDELSSQSQLSNFLQHHSADGSGGVGHLPRLSLNSQVSVATHQVQSERAVSESHLLRHSDVTVSLVLAHNTQMSLSTPGNVEKIALNNGDLSQTQGKRL